MNNPFVISSSTLGKDSNLISLVNMELIKQNEKNGIVFQLDNKDFKKLFVLNQEILDLAFCLNKKVLYVLTYKCIYRYSKLIVDEEQEIFISCDEDDFFKKIIVDSDYIYTITVFDNILKIDPRSKKIVDITPNLDKSDGIEKLYCSKGKLRYAVGWNGLILKYENGNWSEIATPTNRILFSLAEVDTEKIIVVGQKGGILFGYPEALEVIEHDWEDYDFWDVIVFFGRIFLLSEIGVLELTDNLEVVPVIGRPQRQSIFFTFKSYKDKLWAVGENHILEFNGEKWKEVFSLKNN